MRERPILFQGAMVRAIIAGTKTQTRRVAKLPHMNPLGQWEPTTFGGPDGGRTRDGKTIPEYLALWHTRTGDVVGSQWLIGDRLWVRETWMDLFGTGIERRTGDPSRYAYGADTPPGSYGDECRKDYGLKWKPSIHMPRAACRLVLEVTDVRVQRLQAISRGDAMEEGCPFPNMAQGDDPRRWYAELWNQINGVDSWAANPWVWVIEFQRVAP